MPIDNKSQQNTPDGGNWVDPSDNGATFGCTDPEASNYNPQATVDDGTCYDASKLERSDPNFQPSLDAFQSGMASYSGFSTSKKVIDWSSFWSETNSPAIGYDTIDDKLVILKGTDHSADSSKDVLVYDFITGTWTKGDTKLSGSNDMTNMITAPDTGELVIGHQHNSTGILRRFKAHQAASIATSQTVNIVTPFFDFGSSGQKKRLYKVEVLARGTNLDDLAITAAYDGNARASYAGYSNIFSSNTFSNTTALDWDKTTFTVSSPTDFNNVSVRIYATGAMTTADWGISEITFIYREKGIR